MVSRAPFIATYTITASVAPTKSMNNLNSTMAVAAGTLGGATTGGATTGGSCGGTPSGTTLGGTPSGTTLGGSSQVAQRLWRRWR